MSEVTLTVQNAARGGLSLTQNKVTVVTANTYKFQNDGRTKVWVKNVASTCAVSIVTPNTEDGLAIADRSVSIAASENWVLGPFPPETYNDANGNVSMTFDQTVDICAFRG